MITEAIQRYYPDWVPPEDRGRMWVPVLCPFHPDTMKSASLSYAREAFKCHGCDVKGDAVAIVRQQEGVGFEEAVRIAEGLSPGGSTQLPQVAGGKPGRRVFAEPRDIPEQRTGEKVPSGIRGRAAVWE